MSVEELVCDSLEQAIKEAEKYKRDQADVLRDKQGRFAPKRPLEFTHAHFWLEVLEVTVAILIAQGIIEGITWWIKR